MTRKIFLIVFLLFVGCDIDDGKTTIISPPFDLTTYDNPTFSYHRYYTNNQGVNPENDFWNVYVSGDAIDWKRVERTKITNDEWRRFAFRVKDFIDPTATTYLLFEAQDSLIPALQFDGGSIVEAAIDDIILFDKGVNTGLNFSTANMQNITVHPNPAGDFFYIEFEELIGENLAVEIFETTGKLVKTFVRNGLLTQTTKINISDLSDGVYLLNVLSDSEVALREKLVIGR